MVSSIFYKRISLQIWVYFAFGVSETITKYVDIVRVISSIPSLNSRTPSCDTYANSTPADLRRITEGLRTPTATPRASATSDPEVGGAPRSYLTSTTSSSSLRHKSSRWHSVSESTTSSPGLSYSATLPRVYESPHGHGHRHRRNDRLLLRICCKTSKALQASSLTTTTLYASKQMAKGQGSTIIRGSC
jgi:hypothetical protein